jgi:acetyltransferase-like isoleucine patch superfamily enzyme
MKQYIWQVWIGVGFLWMRFIALMPSHSVRLFLYRRAGMKIGRRSVIYSGAEIRNPKGIFIGDDVSVGHEAKLDGRRQIYIESNVNLSTGVWIWTEQHDPQSSSFETVGATVYIRRNAWLSARVIVLPGVCIEEGCVVAAGAVVTKSLPAYSICAGIPAKKIGERTRDIRYRLGDHLPVAFI